MRASPESPALLSPLEARACFPYLGQKIYGKDNVFLDSAASAQKPRQVIDALSRCYAYGYANIHRGMYYLSNKATDAFEETRDSVAGFINAASRDEIVFTRGATEAINLAAFCLSESLLKAGDTVLVTETEHHANLLPWEQACKRTGASLHIVPVRGEGGLVPAEDIIAAIAKTRPRIVAVTQMSNATGYIYPVKEICKAVSSAGAISLIDACQSVVHTAIDVRDIGCDFLAFSGHKLYGPNGTGVLYGRKEILSELPPYMTGGEMVDKADPLNGSTFQPAPLRFEAGTPVIAETIALAEAIRFVDTLDRSACAAQERDITAYLVKEIEALDGYRVINKAAPAAGIVSFIHERAAPSDIGELCDRSGIALRAGHHCAQPLMRAMKLSATVRASLGVYNTHEEAELLVKTLKRVGSMF